MGIGHDGVGRNLADIPELTVSVEDYEGEYAWATSIVITNGSLEPIDVRFVLLYWVVEMILFFSVVEDLRPLLLPTFAEDPTRIVLFFEDYDSGRNDGNNVYLRVVSRAIL